MGEDFLTVSIVTYHNLVNQIQVTVESVLQYKGSLVLYISDNSKSNTLERYFFDKGIPYYFNNKNLGFGAAHNKVIEKSINSGSKYHIILNPDVYFGSGVIEKLVEFMNSNEDVGLVMPKIRYPNGEIQYLCKLLPSPFDWIFRRFSPFKRKIERRNEKYELRFTGYKKQMEVPSLSGCFMFIRTSILKEIGGFDERYFMYAEDVDLCRRIGQKAKTVYYPEVEIVHNYEKGSYKSKKLLFYHVASAIKYFNKWGWIFEKDRKKINVYTLKKLNYKSK